MMRIAGIFIASIIAFGACAHKDMNVPNTTTSNTEPVTTAPKNDSLTYLALGDSYTIGEAVHTTESFPYQLMAQLRTKGIKAAVPQIIAQTGWRTDDLQSAVRRATLKAPYDYVTLLIGVNNQYQGGDPDTYRAQFKQLLDTATILAGNNAGHVFVLSIPDWSVTPFAASSGRNLAQIAAQIDQFNDINADESRKDLVNYINITDISREAATEPDLIASDGLHPSGRMYQLWVNRFVDQVAAALK